MDSIDLSSINYMAILIAIVANQIIGAMWYSVLFGKKWMAAVGINPEDVTKQEATRGMVLSILFAIIGYFILAVFIHLTNVGDWAGGAVVGLLLGLFAAVPTATNYTYEGRGNTLFFINAFYPIVAYTVGGIIIGVWL